jgi:hypothetical protein
LKRCMSTPPWSTNWGRARTSLSFSADVHLNFIKDTYDHSCY